MCVISLCPGLSCFCSYMYNMCTYCALVLWYRYWHLGAREQALLCVHVYMSMLYTITCRKRYLVGPEKQQSLDRCFELVSSHQQGICIYSLSGTPSLYMPKMHQNACVSMALELLSFTISLPTNKHVPHQGSKKAEQDPLTKKVSSNVHVHV